MPATVKVKSANVAVKSQREATAQRVIALFGNQLPDLRLLCFFDDTDCQALKEYIGEANRGFYAPVKECKLWPYFPDYLKKCVLVEDPSSFYLKPAFDHVIYLHGTTCSNEIGLTMTFAHELQHFVQHSNVLKLWAENSLIQNLPRELINALGLKWFDIPIEREARIISKRTAENLFGAEPVRQFIDRTIAEAVNADDAADWRFIQGISTSAPSSYDVARESRLIFQRLRPHRSEFEKLLQEVRDDPNFKGVTVNGLFENAGG